MARDSSLARIAVATSGPGRPNAFVRAFIVAQIAFALAMYATFVRGATAPDVELPDDVVPVPHETVARSATRRRRYLAPWIGHVASRISFPRTMH